MANKPTDRHGGEKLFFAHVTSMGSGPIRRRRRRNIYIYIYDSPAGIHEWIWLELLSFFFFFSLLCFTLKQFQPIVTIFQMLSNGCRCLNIPKRRRENQFFFSQKMKNERGGKKKEKKMFFSVFDDVVVMWWNSRGSVINFGWPVGCHRIRVKSKKHLGRKFFSSSLVCLEKKKKKKKITKKNKIRSGKIPYELWREKKICNFFLFVAMRDADTRTTCDSLSRRRVSTPISSL